MVDTGLAGNLDVAKVPPSVVADAVLAGLARNRDEICIARVKQLGCPAGGQARDLPP